MTLRVDFKSSQAVLSDAKSLLSKSIQFANVINKLKNHNQKQENKRYLLPDVEAFHRKFNGLNAEEINHLAPAVLKILQPEFGDFSTDKIVFIVKWLTQNLGIRDVKQMAAVVNGLDRATGPIILNNEMLDFFFGYSEENIRKIAETLGLTLYMIPLNDDVLKVIQTFPLHVKMLGEAIVQLRTVFEDSWRDHFKLLASFPENAMLISTGLIELHRKCLLTSENLAILNQLPPRKFLSVFQCIDAIKDNRSLYTTDRNKQELDFEYGQKELDCLVTYAEDEVLSVCLEGLRARGFLDDKRNFYKLMGNAIFRVDILEKLNDPDYDGQVFQKILTDIKKRDIQKQFELFHGARIAQQDAKEFMLRADFKSPQVVLRSMQLAHVRHTLKMYNQKHAGKSYCLRDVGTFLRKFSALNAEEINHLAPSVLQLFRSSYLYDKKVFIMTWLTQNLGVRDVKKMAAVINGLDREISPFILSNDMLDIFFGHSEENIRDIANTLERVFYWIPLNADVRNVIQAFPQHFKIFGEVILQLQKVFQDSWQDYFKLLASFPENAMLISTGLIELHQKKLLTPENLVMLNQLPSRKVLGVFQCIDAIKDNRSPSTPYNYKQEILDFEYGQKELDCLVTYAEDEVLSICLEGLRVRGFLKDKGNFYKLMRYAAFRVEILKKLNDPDCDEYVFQEMLADVKRNYIQKQFELFHRARVLQQDAKEFTLLVREFFYGNPKEFSTLLAEKTEHFCEVLSALIELDECWPTLGNSQKIEVLNLLKRRPQYANGLVQVYIASLRNASSVPFSMLCQDQLVEYAQYAESIAILLKEAPDVQVFFQERKDFKFLIQCAQYAKGIIACLHLLYPDDPVTKLKILISYGQDLKIILESLMQEQALIDNAVFDRVIASVRANREAIFTSAIIHYGAKAYVGSEPIRRITLDYSLPAVEQDKLIAHFDKKAIDAAAEQMEQHNKELNHVSVVAKIYRQIINDHEISDSEIATWGSQFRQWLFQQKTVNIFRLQSIVFKSSRRQVPLIITFLLKHPDNCERSIYLFNRLSDLWDKDLCANSRGVLLNMVERYPQYADMLARSLYRERFSSDFLQRMTMIAEALDELHSANLVTDENLRRLCHCNWYNLVDHLCLLRLANQLNPKNFDILMCWFHEVHFNLVNRNEESERKYLEGIMQDFTQKRHVLVSACVSSFFSASPLNEKQEIAKANVTETGVALDNIAKAISSFGF